jgi:hypothetical protein
MNEETRAYLVPLVGVQVDPDKPDEVVQAYEDVNAALRLLANTKRDLTALLVEHSIKLGRRTVQVPGGVQYERTGGPEVTYRDPADLARKLLEAGMPAARVREIVVTTIDHKVNGTQANAASRANPEYERIISEHRVTTERPYRISVKPHVPTRR